MVCNKSRVSASAISRQPSERGSLCLSARPMAVHWHISQIPAFSRTPLPAADDGTASEKSIVTFLPIHRCNISRCCSHCFIFVTKLWIQLERWHALRDILKAITVLFRHSFVNKKYTLTKSISLHQSQWDEPIVSSTGETLSKDLCCHDLLSISQDRLATASPSSLTHRFDEKY